MGGTGTQLTTRTDDNYPFYSLLLKFRFDSWGTEHDFVQFQEQKRTASAQRVDKRSIHLLMCNSLQLLD
jgi:hypothetical protein